MTLAGLLFDKKRWWVEIIRGLLAAVSLLS